MWCEPKNDAVVMEAIAAQNNNDWARASGLFQQAGNQIRNPTEKKLLWEAATKARKIDAQD